jgi:hypothetical protein
MRIHLQVIFRLVAIALGSIASLRLRQHWLLGRRATLSKGEGLLPIRMCRSLAPGISAGMQQRILTGPELSKSLASSFITPLRWRGAELRHVYNLALDHIVRGQRADTHTPANNVGADNTVVFNGTPGFIFKCSSFSLSSPLYYNSSMSNLLLDVFSTDATNPDFSMLLNARNGPPATSSAARWRATMQQGRTVGASSLVS